MTTWLNKLTPEQEALLPKQRDKWVSLGLSTEPANRAEAERGVREAYASAGLPAPRFMIWVDSPYAGAFAQAIAPEIIERTLSAFGAKSSVRSGAQVWDQVGDQVRDQVWDQVGAQVRAQVGAQVWAQVRAQVGDQVRDWSRGLISDYYGIWYSSWFETMRALGVTGLDPWEGQERVAANAYWWWCFKGFVVLSERPKLISRDTQGRLHSSGGNAVEWPDGWGFHAWHGTRVPEWVITDPTPERIFAERNTEVRRAAVERFGWDEFIHVSGMKQVGESVADPGNGLNELSLWDLSDELRDLYDESARVLLCTNGSPERDGSYHRFGLIVPAHHADPVEAAAELYGWSAADYRALEVRR